MGMKSLLIAAIAWRALFLAGCADDTTYKDKPQQIQESTTMPAVDYKAIEFNTITGDSTDLDQFKGKVVLIVNTASKCGFTPQYEGLEKLYEAKKDKGFVVIGFPANNFKNQEPGTNEEIQKFCQTKYHVTFPMMAKISVKGDDIHPLYRYLTEDSPFPGEITWNFNKFLLDRDGKVVARYDSKITPEDAKLIAKIDELLKLGSTR
jgi:glutathione peroxidase